jgi:hypothetical protein
LQKLEGGGVFVPDQIVGRGDTLGVKSAENAQSQVGQLGGGDVGRGEKGDVVGRSTVGAAGVVERGVFREKGRALGGIESGVATSSFR